MCHWECTHSLSSSSVVVLLTLSDVFSIDCFLWLLHIKLGLPVLSKFSQSVNMVVFSVELITLRHCVLACWVQLTFTVTVRCMTVQDSEGIPTRDDVKRPRSHCDIVQCWWPVWHCWSWRLRCKQGCRRRVSRITPSRVALTQQDRHSYDTCLSVLH